MAKHLYRLGGWAFERKKTVLALWAMVLVGVIASAMAFGGSTNDKFTVPGTESQDAQELLEQKYPEASGTYASVVFAAPAGETLNDPENKAAVQASMARANADWVGEIFEGLAPRDIEALMPLLAKTKQSARRALKNGDAS